MPSARNWPYSYIWVRHPGRWRSRPLYGPDPSANFAKALSQGICSGLRYTKGPCSWLRSKRGLGPLRVTSKPRLRPYKPRGR